MFRNLLLVRTHRGLTVQGSKGADQSAPTCDMILLYGLASRSPRLRQVRTSDLVEDPLYADGLGRPAGDRTGNCVRESDSKIPTVRRHVRPNSGISADAAARASFGLNLLTGNSSIDYLRPLSASNGGGCTVYLSIADSGRMARFNRYRMARSFQPEVGLTSCAFSPAVRIGQTYRRLLHHRISRFTKGTGVSRRGCRPLGRRGSSLADRVVELGITALTCVKVAGGSRRGEGPADGPLFVGASGASAAGRECTRFRHTGDFRPSWRIACVSSGAPRVEAVAGTVRSWKHEPGGAEGFRHRAGRTVSALNH